MVSCAAVAVTTTSAIVQQPAPAGRCSPVLSDACSAGANTAETSTYHRQLPKRRMSGDCLPVRLSSSDAPMSTAVRGGRTLCFICFVIPAFAKHAQSATSTR